MSLLLLFLSAFGAATLLPLQSEAVLLGLFSAEQAACSAVNCGGQSGEYSGVLCELVFGSQD